MFSLVYVSNSSYPPPTGASYSFILFTLSGTVKKYYNIEFYIVPRTGVFTTYTRLNTGLRLQRGPELDGDHNVECPDHMAYGLSVYIVPRTGRLTARKRTTTTCCRSRSQRANGRHWMRVELGTILMKFAFEISVQLWSPL